MACNEASCQSGCYKDNNDEAEQLPPEKIESLNGVMPTVTDYGDNQLSNICLKCKTNETIAAITGGNVNGGDGCRFCADCFRTNLFGKFKFAVTSNAMISPSDKVLVAFSGGPSSRVALQFVHEMQHKAQKNFDASRDRSLPVFGVGVALIDESASCPVPSHEFNEAMEDMKAIMLNLTPPRKDFHVVPIESVCSSDTCDGRDKLKELLNTISDVTGKEDLLVQLRMLCLHKIALENGYTRLLLGSCTSRIACHVIAATVKGQGYSLAADIQYVDARSEIPVVLPLRDCLTQELNMLCRLEGLKTVELFSGSRAGINGLISTFIKLLQEENPSRECTIVRTAGKLTPFHFNRIPESDDFNDQMASRRRQKKYNLKSNESLPPEYFCPICNSPLNKNGFPNLITFENSHTNPETFRSRCCASCQFQILPKEPLPMEHFYSLLPNSVTTCAKNDSNGNQRWLREQIQDCLLSVSDDGS